MQEDETREYIVRIPAYEITVEAKSEAEACELALQQVYYEDMKISAIGW